MPSPIDPRAREVGEAISKLEADPTLAHEETVRVLRWADKPDTTEHGNFEWLRDLLEWLGNLFSWFAQSGRVLMWVLAGILAAGLALYIFRLVRQYERSGLHGGFVAPSHVRDLDIRPESLPDDVGAAALALWERGEQRAALALLYRGLLSRLVHAHRVPIRDSSTEGDSLALAHQHAGHEPRIYASRLIPVWQRAVYGAQAPTAQAFTALCHDFAAALEPRQEFATQEQPA